MSCHEANGPQPHMFVLYLPENAGDGKVVAGLGAALGRNSILLHQRVNLLIKSLDQTLHLLNPFLYFPH